MTADQVEKLAANTEAIATLKKAVEDIRDDRRSDQKWVRGTLVSIILTLLLLLYHVTTQDHQKPTEQVVLAAPSH